MMWQYPPSKAHNEHSSVKGTFPSFDTINILSTISAPSLNPLLLFTHRKGNHRSSEWQWGLQSFASFPTKQVVSMRQLAIVFCLVWALEGKKKKRVCFLQSRLPKLQIRAVPKDKGTCPLTPSPSSAQGSPYLNRKLSLPENQICRNRGQALCPNQQVFQLPPQCHRVLRK